MKSFSVVKNKFVLSHSAISPELRDMEAQKTISGPEAIRRMRLITKVKDSYFTLIHFTANLKKQTGGELRKVERCTLRPALPDGLTRVDPDHYLTYVDASTDEPRMCWKKLIRYVAFPPNYELLKVDWFNG